MATSVHRRKIWLTSFDCLSPKPVLDTMTSEISPIQAKL